MLRLRPPEPDEGPALTGLCLRSKAAHGYNAAFMKACREELTVDPAKAVIAVAVLGDAPAGVAEISLAGDTAELEKLFVEPAHHGRGIGRALFEWAKAQAAERGARALMIDSDPGAVTFYEKMGAAVNGCSPSRSIPGRLLPRLRLRLDEVEEA